jgi:hypothetical protein
VDPVSLRLVSLLQAYPEHLAITKYQTVARLRTKIFRKLSPGLLAIFKHQHTVDDLEVFFIVTALLSGDGNGATKGRGSFLTTGDNVDLLLRHRVAFK